MTNKKEIYKCSICGNIVEVLHSGAGVLICCGQNMVLMKEGGAEEEGDEKHVPVIEDSKVSVGSVLHPMEAEHYIEWIEGAGVDGVVAKVFLNPGDPPEVDFGFQVESARAYCNVHGLWNS